jgi:hypothetical protein
MSAVRPKAEVRVLASAAMGLGVDAVARHVIQAPKPEPRIIMRYELTDPEWAAIKPMLPNKPRGVPSGERPARPQWHLLGLAIRSAMARPSG